MNCTNLYAYKKVGKKGKTQRVSIRPDWLEVNRNLYEYVEPFQACTGTLSVGLSVTNGCCCHESAELDIIYTCTECGVLNFPPTTCGDKYDFASFVNALMAAVPTLNHEDSLTLEYARRDRRNLRVSELVSAGMKPSDALFQAMKEELR